MKQELAGYFAKLSEEEMRIIVEKSILEIFGDEDLEQIQLDVVASKECAMRTTCWIFEAIEDIFNIDVVIRRNNGQDCLLVGSVNKNFSDPLDCKIKNQINEFLTYYQLGPERRIDYYVL